MLLLAGTESISRVLSGLLSLALMVIFQTVISGIPYITRPIRCNAQSPFPSERHATPLLLSPLPFHPEAPFHPHSLTHYSSPSPLTLPVYLSSLFYYLTKNPSAGRWASNFLRLCLRHSHPPPSAPLSDDLPQPFMRTLVSQRNKDPISDSTQHFTRAETCLERI